ncbi:MAG: KH domain-containing protein [Candidatus Pacearchaeota archaeon]|jgi:KH domain-containing protein
MENLFCDKVQRISKNRKKLEKSLNLKIDIKGNEVIFDGEAEDEYIGEKVIESLDFGFPFSVALLVKSEDLMLEILKIKDYSKRRDLEVVRARIIGKGGKTLRALHELTKCYFEIKGNDVGIIGEPEYIKNATEALIFLIQGSKHSNVYTFLERHQVKPILDLGLKPLKKLKRKKK